MNEAIRMDYLEAMGIEMYVPRRILSAAKPSVQAPLPIAPLIEPTSAALVGAHEAEVIERAAVKSPKQLAGIIGQLEDIKHSLKPTSAKREVKGESKSENIPESALEGRSLQDEVADRQVRFCLNVWQLPGLLIIDSHLPKAALPTDQLLNNMLMAKGYASVAKGFFSVANGFDTGLPRGELLKWPILPSEKTASLNAAREMLQSFITERFDGAFNYQCWIMGRDAFAVVAPQELNFDEMLGRSFNQKALNMLAVCLPSLADMLNNPQLKAPAWHAIRDIPLPKAMSV